MYLFVQTPPFELQVSAYGGRDPAYLPPRHVNLKINATRRLIGGVNVTQQLELLGPEEDTYKQGGYPEATSASRQPWSKMGEILGPPPIARRIS